MATPSARVALRATFLILLLLAAYYVGRPLYWKLSATVHEIRENRQTVKEGLSQIMLEAQRTVGWVHDESDAGVAEGQSRGKATTRRLSRFTL